MLLHAATKWDLLSKTEILWTQMFSPVFYWPKEATGGIGRIQGHPSLTLLFTLMCSSQCYTVLLYLCITECCTVLYYTVTAL